MTSNPLLWTWQPIMASYQHTLTEVKASAMLHAPLTRYCRPRPGMWVSWMGQGHPPGSLKNVGKVSRTQAMVSLRLLLSSKVSVLSFDNRFVRWLVSHLPLHSEPREWTWSADCNDNTLSLRCVTTARSPLHGEWLLDQRRPKLAQGALDARARFPRPVPREAFGVGLTAAARSARFACHPVVGAEDEHTKEKGRISPYLGLGPADLRGWRRAGGLVCYALVSTDPHAPWHNRMPRCIAEWVKKKASERAEAEPHPWAHLLKDAWGSTSDQDVGYKSLRSNGQRSTATKGCTFGLSGRRGKQAGRPRKAAT